MEKNSNSRYRLLLIILIVNTFYSYIFLTDGKMIIFSFLFFVPVAVYSLKHKIDGSLIFSILVVCVVNYMLYDIKDSISYTIIIALPAIIISYLLREMSFAKSIPLSSIILFSCCLGTIVLLKNIFNLDILATYFNNIDAMEEEFVNVYSSLFADNTSSIKEYSIAMSTLRSTFYYMKYYYPALLYLLCLGISAVTILFTGVIAKKLKINNFKYTSIFKLKVSRSIIGFLLIVMLTKTLFNEKSSLIVAFNNILVIITVMLFFLGVLFEMSIIKRVKSAGRRILLIMVSIFCLVFFQAYFVVAGFIDSIFQIRVKLNNA